MPESTADELSSGPCTPSKPVRRGGAVEWADGGGVTIRVDARAHSIQVQRQNAFNRILITAGKIPGDWNRLLMRGIKDDFVPQHHLFGAQYTAERVIHVDVGTRLVQHDVKIRQAFHDFP